MSLELLASHPLWLLLPWAVFALAAGFRFWRITTLFRRHLLGAPARTAPSRSEAFNTEQFRQSLERIWLGEQQA